jgi:2-dehydro-3-deoxyphosphogluconate aldolase / (4S)-4-hydroxy-2-oxoglutarate aldolase
MVTGLPTDIRGIMRISPVLSALTISRTQDAVPLAQALVRGGLPVMYVTLRTSVALAAIRAIRAAVSEAIVGVGTLARPRDFPESREAGAQFGVSPGLGIPYAMDAGFPLLPGIMTPTDLIAARLAGYTACNLFPAEVAGGVRMIEALSRPFPDHAFCPTGGVTRASAPAYLALKNVLCVGGSWVAPGSLIDAQDWAAIEGLARDAATLREVKRAS